MIKKAISYIQIPKKVFYSGLALIVLAAIYWALKPTYAPVDTAKITEGVFVKSFVDEGTTSFKKKYVISSPGDGIVPDLEIEAGDAVKKGQFLFRFLWDRDFVISSPVDGYVLRVFEKNRRHLPRGTPIIEVGDPSELEILAKFLSEEAIEFKVGQKVLISQWGKPTVLEAKISKIEPSAKEEISALGVKEQRVQVHIEIVTARDVWKGLGDSFRVEVTVVVQEKPNAMLLPVGALFSHQGQPSVFALKNGRALIRTVKIGERNRDFIELEEGLAVGDSVILYPGSELKNEDRVRER